MITRVPLVLDDTGNVQKLQRTERLDDRAARVVSVDDFVTLESAFKTLVTCLVSHRIELPEELIENYGY